ncbi:hypothetical protein [Nocardioides sp. R-C-SC26]|uniref:hypothetical protein n=1 Tax=Nocardioides sp. R-C-SC26 TaxID=2870414 RepID=UPI001E324C52|nr:hypothetical protein [Nocardioides sp. R-C-SC26]
MSAPRAVLHVGLPKTGTSFLQNLCRDNADLLAEHGVRQPTLGKEEVFQAVLAVTGRSSSWGRDPDAGQRAWERLAREVVSHRTTTLISSETLCLADLGQIEAILDDLPGVDVEVVVTVRDPARQIPAEWQEGIKHGRRHSFPKFLDSVLDEDPQGPGRADARERFWNAQDPVRVLHRWSAVLGPERVSVVVNPRSGAPRDELWLRFARVLGVADAPVVIPDSEVNSSLGWAQTEVLRRVNRRFVRRGNERAYGDLVKRLYAGTILRGQAGTKVTLPPGRHDDVMALATAWVETIEAAGHPVAGDLTELLPLRPDAQARAERGSVSTDDMLEVALDASAELLVEIERLRAELAVARGGASAAVPRQVGAMRRLRGERGTRAGRVS